MTERSSADSIKQNLLKINENIELAAAKSGRNRKDIILLAATKTVDAERINEAIENGLEYVAENRVQELLQKHEHINGNAHQHFIGHLQTNKVRDVIGRVELIHSVHSEKLAKEISKQAAKKNIVQNVLVQINIGNEDSKSGFDFNDAENAVKTIAALPNISVKGLMAIPPICEDAEQNRKYFAKMYKLFVDIGAKNIDNSSMVYLSMGMSSDYMTAIEEGANIVRIGSAIFGHRDYNK